MSRHTEDQLTAALLALDIDPKPSTIGQFRVMVEALEIFTERNARYRDSWRHDGWRGALFQLRAKVKRMWVVFWEGSPTGAEADVDDALDVINYTVFFIRNKLNNNEFGGWR